MKNKAPRKKPAVNRVYYIYVGILAVLFFTFHTIPFLKGVMYSFTDWRGYGEWNFVGLRNYIHMFSDVDTGNAYLFTFKFAVITTILVNVINQSFLFPSIYAGKSDRRIYFQLYFCEPDSTAGKRPWNQSFKCKYSWNQSCHLGNCCGILMDRMRF